MAREGFDKMKGSFGQTKGMIGRTINRSMGKTPIENLKKKANGMKNIMKIIELYETQGEKKFNLSKVKEQKLQNPPSYLDQIDFDNIIFESEALRLIYLESIIADCCKYNSIKCDVLNEILNVYPYKRSVYRIYLSMLIVKNIFLHYKYDENNEVLNNCIKKLMRTISDLDTDIRFYIANWFESYIKINKIADNDVDKYKIIFLPYKNSNKKRNRESNNNTQSPLKKTKVPKYSSKNMFGNYNEIIPENREKQYIEMQDISGRIPTRENTNNELNNYSSNGKKQYIEMQNMSGRIPTRENTNNELNNYSSNEENNSKQNNFTISNVYKKSNV